MKEPQIWYDRNGKPIDREKANSLLGDITYVRVARTEIVSASAPGVTYEVSTVWLGCRHNFVDDGPPIIFETMAFGGDDNPCVRYATEEAARSGHAQMVESVAASVPGAVVRDVTRPEPRS